MKPSLARRANKAVAYSQAKSSTVVKQSEQTQIQKRRIQKAERDERMDLTALLTPVRTYMGGFTKPTELRISRYALGGRYMSQGRSIERPPKAAYEPHTVFLLESRYNVKYEPGRTESVDHIVGLCRAPDLEAVVKRFNSKRAPVDAKESMDNARWPWTPQRSNRPNGHASWWSRESEIKDSIANVLDNVAVEPVLSPQADNNLAKPSKRERPERPEDKLKQTAAVLERVKEDQLEGIESEMRRPDGKIPFEVEHPDGGTYHPSGFKVPTSVADFARSPLPPPEPHHTRTPKPMNPDAAIDHEQWKVVREKDGHLMADLASDVSHNAHTIPRSEKIPTEVTGIMDRGQAQPPQHASGFIPPTPAMARGHTEALTHTVHSEEVVAAREEYDNKIKELRKRYLQEIETTPFWRPLLAITVATRPIGATLSRLSRGLARGLPFYASVESDGRKSVSSFGNRMRCMRLDRMQELVVEMAQVLAGARGGPIGIRFDPDQAARGVDGEGFGQPIPWEKRSIGVGVGEWYDRADEVKESYELAQDDVRKYEDNPVKEPPFRVYDLSEWGSVLPVELKDKVAWLKVPKSTEFEDETIRPVLDEISMLKDALRDTEGQEQSERMRVWAEKKPVDAEGKLVNEPGYAREVRLLKQGREPPPGAKVIVGNEGRAWIKRRLEYLNAKHREQLAHVLASRSTAVTYP